MSQQNSITYGVFILDLDGWRQVSEHWLLPQAIERACESHEILGAQIRVRSSLGIILLEIPHRSGPSPVAEQRTRTRRSNAVMSNSIFS